MGYMTQRVSVQGGKCPGGKLCPEGIFPWGKCPGYMPRGNMS